MTKEWAHLLTGNVGDHDEDEEGVVVEGEVVLVGEGDGVQACFLHVWKSCVDGQQFSRHSHRIQHNEKGVPAAQSVQTENQGKSHHYPLSLKSSVERWAALLL